MLLFWKHSAQYLCRLVAISACFLALQPAHAGLFDDEEARKAILDLRTRVDQHRQAQEAQNAEIKRNQDKALQDANESNAALRRSLLDLQAQMEALRADLARLRGQDEQLARDVAEMQRRQKDLAQGVDERVRRFEPTKVQLDGREFMAEPNEKRDYDNAFALFRKPDYAASSSAFADFIRRNPQSGYTPSAYFWLGNAQYANKEYSAAITNFRAMISAAPDHPKAPEAALGLANSQIELKDNRAARRTLDDLIKAYPQSEAAVAAKDRLTRLR
ncbi:tol-pal system protein YbgF [Variovorax sp. PCZ-1]|uniref:tol-pal system protein YbgF n=1 Tax=Variovorax sp. PCZ-1 TaxID=2835533 RepID=UPI001BCE49E2|nr:tol-pal system protein YbgF [Variovorax sp. PCZ-1]MBS7807088.1 tol-pal system protein YbgF [Variovorax sp. PCZ-1]